MAVRSAPSRASQSEAERPFWISFSDLMTALMVLFLVAMAVAIHEVKKGNDARQAALRERDGLIHSCMEEVGGVTEGISGLTLRDYSIDFGSRANFQLNRYDLTPEQATVLRSFVPQVLAITQKKSCESWLKRVVVEGFASNEGTYLNNLNLSIERSERVLCALLDANAAGAIDNENRKLIQKLFFVGGSSSNSLKRNPADSRRIELRLEFYDLKEPREAETYEIPLDTTSTCPIDRR